MDFDVLHIPYNLFWQSNHSQNKKKEKLLTFMSFCISNINESINYFAHLFHLSYYTVVHCLLIPYHAVLLAEHLIYCNSLLFPCSPPFHTERYLNISVVRWIENAKNGFWKPRQHRKRVGKTMSLLPVSPSFLGYIHRWLAICEMHVKIHPRVSLYSASKGNQIRYQER